MAAAALDRLITRLELEDKFTPEAKKAKEEAKELAAELAKAAGSTHGLKDVVKEHFTNAAASTFIADDAMKALVQNTIQGVESLGSKFGTLAANTVKWLGSEGIGGAATMATTLLSGFGLVAAAALMAVASAAGFMAGALVAAFNTLLPVAVTFGQTLLAAFAPLMALPLLKMAQVLDDYKHQFSAILGSKGAGNQAVKWVQQYGIESVLTQEPLMDAARTAYLQGQRPSRILPILETLALAGGPNKDENLHELTMIFRRIMGGETGMALGPEGLGRFGISRNMLSQYGAKFDSNNQFIGTGSDALDVLERLTKENEQLKRLREEMAEAIGTKMSNAVDALMYAGTVLGDSLAKSLLPIIQDVTNGIKNLADSGMLQDVVKAYMEFLGGSDGIKRLFSYGLAFIEKLPSIFQGALEAVKHMGLALEAMLHMVAIGLKGIPGPFGLIGDAIESGITVGHGLIAGAQMFVKGTGIEDRANEYYKAMNAPGVKSGDMKEPPPPPKPPDIPIANSHLAKIEEHTAKLVDMTRSLGGGGNLFAKGVTVSDVSMMRGRAHSHAAQRLLDVVGDVVQEAIEAERRAGGNAYAMP